MADWASIASTVGAVIVTALVNHKVTTSVQGERIEGHTKKLEEHDGLHKEHAKRFGNLHQEFVPRTELTQRFETFEKSQERTEKLITYVALNKKPEPPEL